MCEDFWLGVKRLCESGIRIDDGKFDLNENKRDGSCLGTALTAEVRAYSLILVGMDNQAEVYLRSIREHALTAFEMGESYVYRPIGGRNLFGEYMALRIAGLADWALAGQGHQQYNREAASRLAQAIELEYEGEISRAKPVEVTSYCLLRAQLTEWSFIASVANCWLSGKRRPGSTVWSSLLVALAELADSFLSQGSLADARKCSLVRVFRSITDQRKHKEIYDTRMTMNDVVSLARVVCESVCRFHDPWRAIRAIRDAI